MGNTSRGSRGAQLGDDESQLRYLSPEGFSPSAAVFAKLEFTFTEAEERR